MRRKYSRKKIDLTGRRFGRLTVIYELHQRQRRGEICWFCRCDCGSEISVKGCNLRSGKTKSCGCLWGERQNLIGQRFGKLVALRRLPERTDNKVVWECLCDCGSTTQVMSTNLRSGNTLSCGCFGRERAAEIHFKHGHSGRNKPETLTYKKWKNAKTRVTNPRRKYWYLYGGRGITMCDRWLNSFEAFLEDMGECPKGMTLDRIDANGDYEPGNCRWTDTFTQANNTRRNVMVGHNGVEYTMSEYCRIMGIEYHPFRKFYRDWGMSLQEATEESLRREQRAARSVSEKRSDPTDEAGIR